MKKGMRFVCCMLTFILQAVHCDDLDDCALEESTIAVLDLQDYYNKNTQTDFIEKVKNALHHEGFFALKNTGVNKDIINKAYDGVKEFFSLPMETKFQADGTVTNQQRGYSTIGTEVSKGSTIGDFKEYYSVGRKNGSGQWDNIWPECMNLETPLTNYYDHMDEYAHILYEIFSKALGQEDQFLEKVCGDGDSLGRLIHYPCDQSNYSKDAQWSREHTDINLFTILPRATEKGLEARDREGNWKSMYVKEDAFVINAGDFLEIFSNGFFLSAKHRVKKPKNMKRDRYSAVMFVSPGSCALLYPLQKWIDVVGEQRFISATRIEMFMERLADMGCANDEMLKDLADSKVLERLMEVNRASKEAMEAVCKAGYGSDKVKEKLKELKKGD